MVEQTLASIPLHCVAVLSYLRCDAVRARAASKRARSISGRASGARVCLLRARAWRRYADASAPLRSCSQKKRNGPAALTLRHRARAR
eukprot:8311096-Lingulodinium_polyedra.AAC.1